MISDVLSEAVEQIEIYEKDFPNCYGSPEMKTRIAAVKKAMNDLRMDLDNPFIEDHEFAQPGH